jgi:hypothetical protein
MPLIFPNMVIFLMLLKKEKMKRKYPKEGGREVRT